MEFSPQNRKFHIRDLIAVAWRRKWLMIIPTVLLTGVTAVSTFYLTPVFEASVTIFIDKPVRLSQEIERLVGGSGNAIGSNPDLRQAELQSLRNEITSAPYIQQLAKNLGIDTAPWLEEMARKKQARFPGVPLEELKSDMILRDLRDRIRVEIAGVNQFRILATSSNAEQAKMIAYHLGEIFVVEKTRQESRSISISSEFSSEQLATYEQDLQDKITRKTQLETELLQIQPDRLVSSQENREQINTEIQAIGVEISDREKEIRDIQMRIAGLAGGVPTLNESAALKDKKNEISGNLRDLSSLMQKYSWNTPSMVAFKIRLYGLISDVDEEVARIVRAAFSDKPERDKNDLITLFSSRLRTEILLSYRTQLQLALAEIDRRLTLLPGYAASIEQLTREIDAARTLRDQFKLSQEGTQISQALLLESKFRVVEPARLPLAPIWPNKRSIVMLGFLMGACLGAGVILVVEYFDTSIKKPEDAERLFGYSVVGTMPKIEGLEKMKVSHSR